MDKSKVVRFRPAEPEGEGSGEDFSGEDAEKSREEAEENRSASFKEDGVREA